MKASIQFLGASGTVTGSKYLLEFEMPGGKKRVLVDCGMFQGERRWRENNWHDPDPGLLSALDACILTHAHIDHTGLLPRYVANGMRCPIYCTAASADLTKQVLLDSAKLQEEEAKFRAKRGRSRFQPPQPLYTSDQATKVLRQLRVVRFHQEVEVAPAVHVTWSHMGHILGAAALSVKAGDLRLTFSGDIGRYTVPILRDPEALELGELLLVESTYGDRLHGDVDIERRMEEVVQQAFERKGALLIPSFAIGRCQTILYYLKKLQDERRMPDMPIVVDSPMASDATETYEKFTEDYDSGMAALVKKGQKPFGPNNLFFTQSRDDSKRLNSFDGPIIIISASGMLSGGRILHHLLHRLSSPRTTILFVGFQPPGSRGDLIKRGAPEISVLNEMVANKAAVHEISGLSAHADKGELLRWCKSCSGKPRNVAVVHGEQETAEGFARQLKENLAWDTFVPSYQQTFSIG